MIFTLTNRDYEALDAYQTDDYLIGQYIGSIIETLDINIAVKSTKAELWTEGNYIMCVDKNGRGRWFTISEAKDALSDDDKSLSAYSGTIDILAEEYPPFAATEAQPFEWYFNKIFYDTGIQLGINEIASLKRKLEFESQNATNAEMLQFVLNGFDNAEAQLEVEFSGVTPQKLILNVYKRLGHEEPQELLSDEDDSLTELDRTRSITNLGTSLYPTAQGDGDTTITLRGKYYEEKDTNGNILYYSPIDQPYILSVEGRSNYYVKLPGKGQGELDGYINRNYSSQAKTQDSLWAEGLTQLKKMDHVIVEYAAKGNINCGIGDSVQIISHRMRPQVMVAARVIEYKFNDDDPERNEYKFSNYVELESNLDELDQIIEKIKESVVSIASQIVEYSVSSAGNIPPENGWSETFPTISVGQYLWTRTTTTQTNGAVVVGYSVSRNGINGEKGATGPQGPQGIQGPQGPNGQTTYTWIKYATSSTGANMSDSPTGKTYIGIAYNKTTATESTNAADYAWSLIQGPKGDTGPQGPTGPKGDRGLPGIPYLQPNAPTGTIEEKATWFKTVSTTDKSIKGVYTYLSNEWIETPMTQDALSVTSLAAITATLGDVTAGTMTGISIKSGEFLNDFSYVASGITFTGSTEISNGNVVIQRVGSNGDEWVTQIDRQRGFMDVYVPKAGGPSRSAVISAGQLTMMEAGYGGTLPARALSQAVWTNLALRTGFSVAENNPPQYRVTYNLDGTRRISFRGQFKKSDGSKMPAGSDNHPFDMPASLAPKTTIMSYGGVNGGNGSRPYIISTGFFGAIIGSSAADYVDISMVVYDI